jgi:hypothetical protein
VQNRLRVDREGRIPPGLAAGLIVLVLVIGALAYSAGRFGRHVPAPPSPAELPAPAAPVPAVAETVPTPSDIPPTVTPSVPVLIEKGSRASRVLVEKSLQVVVPLPPGPVPTARPTPLAGVPPEGPPPRRRIVVETQATPPPQPTPTVPELEQGNENEEPAPEETPGAPEPTPPVQPRGSPASI